MPSRQRAFRILFLGLVCIGLGQSILFSTLPPAARELGLSPFLISTIFAVSATLWVFVSPWWGRRSDVLGRRPIILGGLLGYALSMALVATTVTLGRSGALAAGLVYPCLIGSRSLFALLGSGTGPAAQAYVADRTSYTDRTAGVAYLNAAMGLGETVGPGVGSLLAAYGLTVPLYFAAGFAVASAGVLWGFLPEENRPRAHATGVAPRLGAFDRRVLPFLAIAAALQAVRATTTITLALFLQDVLALSAVDAARYAGVGFVVIALSSLVSQLVVVQRVRPTARAMLRTGVPLMLSAFVVLAAGRGLPLYLVAFAMLGSGLGLVRPGSAAAASLVVEPHEQGAVAGVMSGLAVIGNVVGPMVATTLYAFTPRAPFVLNASVMAGALGLVLASPRVRRLRG
jgi:MFS family permease